MVQLHHPDHNNGSPESARRFEEVQEAYGQIVRLRRRTPPPRATPEPPPSDPDVERRLAGLERELREAHAARERARRAASEAAARAYKRPSDEELGYVTTDDSLGKILADAREEFSGRLAEARDQPAGRRVSDLIDELASKLTGEFGGRRRTK